MKGKNIISTVLLIAAAMFIYIGISSILINENYYRELAWEVANHDKTIINWQTANVSLINVKENPIHTAPVLSAKINRSILILNGGHAVRIEFSTTNEGLLGPIVLYFNPFTKQCIGGDLRM
mgnify:CR=1 FL=1